MICQYLVALAWRSEEWQSPMGEGIDIYDPGFLPINELWKCAPAVADPGKVIWGRGGGGNQLAQLVAKQGKM